MMVSLVKRSFVLVCLLLFLALVTRGSWYSHLPYSFSQPDGSKVECFVSGDEFHNWIHDQNEFTLIPGEDGFLYYAEILEGTLRAGHYRAGSVDPATVGLTPGINLSETDFSHQRRQASAQQGLAANAPHTGLFNNLVIYIRFQDDAEFLTSRSSFDNLFNNTAGPSLKSYFAEVSYNQLNVNSSHYPVSPLNSNRSYQDGHSRGYYQPYNATGNPAGYSNDDERINREHTLLKNAIEYVMINSPVPSSLNLDQNNDGNIDNITFIIKGANAAWSQLLWAHSWQLFSYQLTMNGKHVWGYNLIPENQAETRTLCHELFHSLGAPDLYHYSVSSLQPVGYWDIMESGWGHMGAWMKYRYSGHSWIADIPEIQHSGTYELNPLENSTGQCYRVASPNSSDEFFVIEYRKASGMYESSLPGSGILVYRIDTSYSGNASGPPDEVYIYRPNGNLYMNGSPANANFSLETGRTTLNDGSNPSCFLQDGSNGGLQIYNVGQAGNTIQFSILVNELQVPASFVAEPAETGSVDLSWTANSNNDAVLVVASKYNQFGIPVDGNLFPAGSTLPGGGEVLYNGSAGQFSHLNLGNHETWHYRIYSVTAGLHYSNAVSASCTTLCGSNNLPFSENFTSSVLPDCWGLQHGGTGTIDNWDVIAANHSGGTGNELRSTFQHVSNGFSRLILPAFNTLGMASLEFSFRYQLDDWAPGAFLRVQSSPDGINWTHESWSLSTHSNTTIGPHQVHLSITNHLNQPATYLAFVVEGDLHQYDFWYIDDVKVSCSAYIPVLVQATAEPSLAGSVSGTGVFPTGQTVELHAEANEDWGFLNWTENGSIVSTYQDIHFPASERILVASFSNTHASLGLSGNPACGGMTSGGGIYPLGSTVTAIAVPEPGFSFEGWYLEGVLVSSALSYTFVLESTANLVAVFEMQVPVTFAITLSASPDEGGQVLGEGTYMNHKLLTVFAIPYAGWIFDSWRENGAILSYQPGFTFSVIRNYNLQAVFRRVVNICTLVDPPEAGYTNGSGAYLSGDLVELQAWPNAGWVFSAWTRNGVSLSQDSIFGFIAGSDYCYKAVFKTGLGAEDAKLSEARLYPNPAAEMVKIHCTGNDQPRSASIYTLSGQLLSTHHWEREEFERELYVDKLLPGVYFILIQSDSGKTIREKLVVAR